MTNREIIARLRQVLRPYFGRLLVAMAAMTLVAGFNAAQAYMVKPLLDEIFVDKDQAMLRILPLALVLLFLVKGVVYFLYSYLLEWVGQCVIRDLRNRIFAHLHTLSLGFFLETPTGELISRIVNDVSLLQGAVSHALIRVLRDLVSVVGLLVVVFSMDYHLALVALVFLPLASVPIVVFGRRFRRISTSYQRTLGEVTSLLSECFTGIRIVKAFCMERHEQERFARKIDTLFEILMSDTRFRAVSHPVVELLGGVIMAVIIFVGGVQVFKGESTPGTFMAFLTAMFMLYEPVKGVSKINSTIQQGMAAAARIFQLLDVEPDVTDAPDARPLPPFSREIRFEHVSFRYEREEVLHDIDLVIPKGQVLAVVGASGAGKTTLANLIPRFHDVTGGRLLIDGIDVRQVTLASLRRQIALVTQQTILFNDTVRNNIAYGRPDAGDDEIREAARAACALDFIERLPQGFDTVIGESGVRLSGGERQRLSIARALLKDAPILVLDEATSSLDTQSERMVQQALDNLMRHRTTVVIAHRLSTVKNADRILVLDRGRIVESGTHEALLARGGVYANLYEMQYAR